MNRNSKKGFTIVELIIVIAVIAVLAAVLIPTFSNLIQKANEAADQTLIKNLNTALKMDTTVSKHETMSQALNATKANGFDVEKIVARATDNKIVWDSVNDCFAYIEKDKSEPTYIPDTKTDARVAEYQLWAIVNGAELDEKYSSYLAGTEITGTINAKKGVDVGENTGITTIKYENLSSAQKVVIVTNSFDTTITVNAASDEVKHYGNAKEVNIAQVAMSSYHEFGTVSGNINLAYGNVELENGSSVSNIVVKTVENVTPATGTVKVAVASGANANLVISETNGVTVNVEGAGASNVSKLENITGKVAAIGSATYDTLESAVSAAKAGDTITLLANGTFGSNKAISKDLSIDLNGNTLNSKAITINPSVNTIIKNGTMIATGDLGLYVLSNAGLRLANIELSGPTFGIFPAGNASFVNIYNSSIKAIVGIATNADGTYSNNVKIEIDSSKIDASGNGAETGVWINVPGTLNIKNSVIKGNIQALMVRAGTAVVSNSQLIMTNNNDGADSSMWLSGDNVWGSGNNVPHAVLVVGDWSKSTGYAYTASCTLNNTKIINERTNWNRANIVLAQKGEIETILNYDAKCGIKNSDYLICNYAVSGLKKGLITVNGTIVQEREQ